jgi:hypothetical protein
VGAADQAVFLQHLQIPANRFGGDIEPVSQLGHLDVPGAAGMIQDQSPAFVACPGLHLTRPLADVGALMMKGVLTPFGPSRPFGKWRSGPLGAELVERLRLELRIDRAGLDVQWNAPLFGVRLMSGLALVYRVTRCISARIGCFLCPIVDRRRVWMWVSGQ